MVNIKMMNLYYCTLRKSEYYDQKIIKNKKEYIYVIRISKNILNILKKCFIMTEIMRTFIALLNVIILILLMNI